MTGILQDRRRFTAVIAAAVVGVAIVAIAYALFTNTATSENTVTAEGEHIIFVAAEGGTLDSDQADGALTTELGQSALDGPVFVGGIDVGNDNDTEAFDWTLANVATPGAGTASEHEYLAGAIDVTIESREAFGSACNVAPGEAEQTEIAGNQAFDSDWVTDPQNLTSGDEVGLCFYFELSGDAAEFGGGSVSYALTFTAVDPA